MKYFLKMVENARTHGVVFANLEGPRMLNSDEMSVFWNIISQNQVFCFSSGNEVLRRQGDSDDALYSAGPANVLEGCDAPFPVFSLECSGDTPLEIMYNESREVKTLCTMCFELEPKVYRTFSLTEENGMGLVSVGFNEENIIEKFVSKLAKESAGVETVRERIKIGTGKDKKTHTIRRIIHVHPKKDRPATTPKGNLIDWSHRWNVRGHWRKCDGLGKDREGNYTQSGHTWVVHHEKGPEHLPLVQKTRFVKEEDVAHV